MKSYTGKGDDGTTGLYFGGRVPKDSDRPEALGAADEAQAAIGLARAEAPEDGELHRVLTTVARDLYVVMAELATAPENRHKLVPGASLLPPEALAAVEAATDAAAESFPPLTDFTVPGQTRLAALLDSARTVVRRAERRAVPVAAPGSLVLPYLNRASSLLWALARQAEAADAGTLLSRTVGEAGPAT